MKKRLIILVILTLAGVFCGCQRNTYKLSGTTQEIESIEILYVLPYYSFTIEELLKIEPDAVIPNEDISLFLGELSALPCTSFFLDPPQGIDGYTIRIHYNDSSWELICYVSGLHYYDIQRFEWKHIQFEQDVFNAFIQKWE